MPDMYDRKPGLPPCAKEYLDVMLGFRVVSHPRSRGFHALLHVNEDECYGVTLHGYRLSLIRADSLTLFMRPGLSNGRLEIGAGSAVFCDIKSMLKGEDMGSLRASVIFVYRGWMEQVMDFQAS